VCLIDVIDTGVDGVDEEEEEGRIGEEEMIEEKRRLTFLQGISAIPSRLTHLTTLANMTFCWVLQFFTNMATGDEDIKFKTAIISFGVTA